MGTNKEQALQKTINKFTNLIDGKVNSNVAVATIIKYYEIQLGIISNQEQINIPTSNITQCFFEEDIKQIEREQDDYYEEFGI
jgi:hypothetical protein